MALMPPSCRKSFEPKACLPSLRSKLRAAVDGTTTRQPGYVKSQQRRKKIEEPIGRAKTIGVMAQTMYRGAEHVRAASPWPWRPAIWRGCRNCSKPEAESLHPNSQLTEMAASSLPHKGHRSSHGPFSAAG